MQAVSNDNFGPLIAYLVPGATVLAALSPFSTTLRGWLAVDVSTSPTVAGFLYVTIASTGVGMTINALRWLLVDSLHNVTGLKAPALNFSALGENVQGFLLLIESHYRHYQFYANMLLATAAAYVCYRVRVGGFTPGWIDLGVLVLEVVFFLTSRDTLRKYYDRSRQLLAAPPRKKG